MKESLCDLDLKGDLVGFISKPGLSHAFAIQQARFGILFYFLTMWTWESFWPWTILQLWTSLGQMSAFEKLGILTLLPLQGLVGLNVKNFMLSDHHRYCDGHIIVDVLMRMQEGLFSHMPFIKVSASDIVLCQLIQIFYFLFLSSSSIESSLFELYSHFGSCFWKALMIELTIFCRLAWHLKVTLS